MDKFTAISDESLFHRLEEIDGQLQDWHISAYKSALLYAEKDDIRTELQNRGYNEEITR